MKADSVVDDRALHELYLKPFEIAVKKSQPWAVMAAYNKLNGVYCTESSWLLEETLRKEWGIQGLVGFPFSHEHRTANSDEQQSRQHIEPGDGGFLPPQQNELLDAEIYEIAATYGPEVDLAFIHGGHPLSCFAIL